MTNPNYLEHYGVLGMKWGVRRYQPYPKGKHGTFLGQSRDEDIVIKKGTEAYRLQAEKDLDAGQKYVSFSKIDHLRYAGVTAGDGGLNINMWDSEKGDYGDGKAHSVTMKLTNDIIAPSYQTTMDAFIETMDNVKLSDITDTNLKYMKSYNDKFLKNVRNYTVDDCRDEAYRYFTSTFMKDTKAKQMFFDNLKKRGYNAIIDENDKQFGEGFTESPMIIFDSSSVKQTKSVPLSSADAKYFANLYHRGADDLTKADLEAKKKWDKWYGKDSSRIGL